MNILFLTPEYATPQSPSGGLGVYVRKTAATLAARGHTVTVLLLSRRNAEWFDECVHIVEVGIAFIPSGIYRLKRLGHYILFLVHRWVMRRAVERLNSENRFDIIQASSYLAPGLLVPRTYPVVCRLSSIEFILRESNANPLRGLDRLLAVFEREQCRRVRALFAPSFFIARKAAEHYGVYAEVIRSAPNAESAKHREADLSFYEQNLSGKRYILYFGQMSYLKGMDIIGKALPYVLKAVPDVHMVFIGRDDGLPFAITCQAYIRAQLDGTLQERMHFFPPLPHSSLMPCVAGSACVLQPTRMDNLPNTCIEALEAQRPVIAATPTSLEELVEDGVNGWLFPCEDATALADITVSFLRGERSLSSPGHLRDFYAHDPIDRLEQFYASYARI